MRVVKRGRKLAESLMDDTVRGTHGSNSVWDETRGEYIETPVVIYEGKARFRFTTATGRAVDDAAAMVTVQAGIMSLPIDGTGSIPVGAVFTVIASRSDEGNVGRRFRVNAIHPQTHSTARRFQVEHYEQGA